LIYSEDYAPWRYDQLDALLAPSHEGPGPAAVRVAHKGSLWRLLLGGLQVNWLW